ncbi:MAG: phosphatidate cytidylyltransferase, partial [Steroidobacteraceae bacterium]|nr:phosphatidate cytidylyltransferase [Steroidobacteraceae bacterium]MDW8260312.1 phosphatidate cytidylyltransferase [Gammaproteobacteria bacterium]
RLFQRGALVVLLALGIAALLIAPPADTTVRWLLAAALVWWLLAFGWITLAPRRGSDGLRLCAGVLSLLPLWLAVVWIRSAVPDGSLWLLFALLVIVGTDTGAFVVGRRWGRIKLAPYVSPQKTWEGVIGGLVLALAVGLSGAHYFGIEMPKLLPLCLAAAAMSVIGDLLESLLKRQAGVKDSGRLVPGHGGVLDRIDSLTAGMPVMALGLDALGVLS